MREKEKYIEHLIELETKKLELEMKGEEIPEELKEEMRELNIYDDYGELKRRDKDEV